jgi:hypothetical protein
MNPTRKQEWLAALRSGKYQQYQGALSGGPDGKNLCCLGVLNDISNLGEWDSTGAYVIGTDLHCDHEQYDPTAVEKEFAHAVVVYWADLSSQNPLVDIGDKRWTGLVSKVTVKDGKRFLEISELNDEGWTFAQLADLIEAQL